MNRVKEYRVARRMSQAELARRVGMCRPSITNIELGKAEPKTSSAFKIAGALGTTVDELFPDEKGEET